MKIYLNNGETVDDGRIARSIYENDGHRYFGGRIEDRDGPTHMSWGMIAAIALLCLFLIYICSAFAAEKTRCDLACREFKQQQELK